MKDNCFKREVLSTGGRINFSRLPYHKSSKLLFNREQERKGKKYYVELLVDASGSMAMDNRIDHATMAAELIAKVLGKFCELQITMFNYLEFKVKWQDFRAEKWGDFYGNSPYENFAEVLDGQKRRIVPEKQAHLYKKTVKSDASTDGNWEICNILNAAKRLKKKNGKRIIIILLDGQPNLDDHPGDHNNLHIAGVRVDQNPYDSIKTTIQKLEKDITILAFGISTDRPKQFYTNFQKINSPEEILESLIMSLQKHI